MGINPWQVKKMSLNQVEYYFQPIIQRKLEEYCSPLYPGYGHHVLDDIVRASAQYFVGYGEALIWEGRDRPFASVRKSKEGFLWILSKGLDFFRSVWDSQFTVFNIDIEYYNHDLPATSYIYPRYALSIVEPVMKKTVEVLSRYNIIPIVIQTGNGVQCSFAIPQLGAADSELQYIGDLEWTVEAKYKNTQSSNRPFGVPIHQGISFDGVGRIVEYLYHKVLRELQAEGFNFPVSIGDINVLSYNGAAEGINFDLSLYFDPIFMRDIRAPFSTHQKHKVQWQKLGQDVAEAVPVQIAIPRLVRDKYDNWFEVDFDTVVGKFEFPGDEGIRRHFDNATELAHTAVCRIPIYDRELLPLLREYRHSLLGKFHQEFDSVHHEAYWRGITSYDFINYEDLPPCVGFWLKNIGGHLLNPTIIQHITRTLMACGFHPKYISGILASKYYKMGGWKRYDQAKRANGWVRVYAGQIVTGLDSLLDFNCVSAKERGLCIPKSPCYNLLDYRNALLYG